MSGLTQTRPIGVCRVQKPMVQTFSRSKLQRPTLLRLLGSKMVKLGGGLVYNFCLHIQLARIYGQLRVHITKRWGRRFFSPMLHPLQFGHPPLMLNWSFSMSNPFQDSSTKDLQRSKLPPLPARVRPLPQLKGGGFWQMIARQHGVEGIGLRR